MITVQNWKDDEILQKEVKTCDNQGLGDSKEIDGQYLVVRKGMRTTRVPRQAVAAFDGDKLFLRVTEAEALAGVYPWLQDDRLSSQGLQSSSQYSTTNTSPP
jgi:hypothetical protein